MNTSFLTTFQKFFSDLGYVSKSCILPNWIICIYVKTDIQILYFNNGFSETLVSEAVIIFNKLIKNDETLLIFTINDFERLSSIA